MDVSLIIPTKDRPAALAECLRHVAGLDHGGHRLEVIVVDDGGRESLEPVVEPLRPRLDVSLHAQENRGPAAARNAGAQRAGGRFLAFTDDDCRPAPDWLRTLLESAEGTGAMVGGHTVNLLPRNPFSTASQDLIDFLYHRFNADPDEARFLTSNNMLVPVTPFRETGGFDERFPQAGAEDRDFCDRWRAWGGAIIYQPEAVIYHRHALGPFTYWRQHFNYGRGAAQFQRARRRRTGDRQRFQPMEFYLDLLAYELRNRRGARASVLTALFAVSQLANAVGFVAERVGARARGERRPRSRGTTGLEGTGGRRG